MMRRYILGLAAIGAAASLSLGMTAASAAPRAGSTLKITFQVNGSTFINSISTTVTLGPGKLAATLASTGKITASLTLPPATASFKQFGVIPVTATTNFLQDGPTTGQLNLKTGAVTTHSKIILQVTNLTAAGIPIPVGSSCETAQPISATLVSGKGFNPVQGGPVSGTYTIGQFANCGLATLLLNLTIPGAGNTLLLNLSHPHIG